MTSEKRTVNRTTKTVGVRLPLGLLAEWRVWAESTGERPQDLAEALFRFGLAHREEVLAVARGDREAKKKGDQCMTAITRRME